MTSEARDQLLAALDASRRVLLTGPVDPDGDSIGACLALQSLLQRRGVEVSVAGDPGYRYAWMPGASAMIRDDDLPVEGWDAVVVLDGDRHRLPPRTAQAFARAGVRGIIDHHASTKADGYTHAWIDARATSTCEMVWACLQQARPGTSRSEVGGGEPLDRDLATQLYVGCIFDTGGFRYSNTTPATHRMAAALLETGLDHATICARILMERRAVGMRLAARIYEHATFHVGDQVVVGIVPLDVQKAVGSLPADLEGIVDAMVYIVGVEVSVLLIEKAPGKVKLSFRSRGKVDVAALAQALSNNGGGHAKAAGALVEGTTDDVKTRVVDALAARLG